ncbi:MAG TPA: hypothetical protein VMX17_09710 [Candidatus Glassbacteria bacterium]|nr:hypothetical protein [Candidatus Glassbacteria bacterium]
MRTKKQLWFNTDLDYYLTEQLLHDSPEVIILSDWKGRITFSLKGTQQVNCQITTHGKFSIAFPIEEDPEKWLSIIRKLLVRKNREPVEVFEKYKEIPEPKEKITPLEEKVEKTIDHLRFLLMRDPTTTEIAYDVGETPEKMRKIAFKLAPKIKWKEPTEDETKEAELRIKEVLQIACLLQHFEKSIIFTRPTSYLGGRLWKDILERANYALKHEKEKVPNIKTNEETEERIEFDFVWSRNSKFAFTTYPEYYYKNKKELSGATWAKEQMKEALNEFKRTINKPKEEQ